MAKYRIFWSVGNLEDEEIIEAYDENEAGQTAYDRFITEIESIVDYGAELVEDEEED